MATPFPWEHVMKTLPGTQQSIKCEISAGHPPLSARMRFDTWVARVQRAVHSDISDLCVSQEFALPCLRLRMILDPGTWTLDPGPTQASGSRCHWLRWWHSAAGPLPSIYSSTAGWGGGHKLLGPCSVRMQRVATCPGGMHTTRQGEAEGGGAPPMQVCRHLAVSGLTWTTILLVRSSHSKTLPPIHLPKARV